MRRRWKTRSCWPRCGKHLEGRRKRCRCLWKKWWRIPRVWNRSWERSSSLEVPGDPLRYVVMSYWSIRLPAMQVAFLMVNMGTQGVVFVLQGRPAVAENQRHRAFYHTLSDSEAKLQFFAARQVACRILGSHGYLCHDVSSRFSSLKNIPENFCLMVCENSMHWILWETNYEMHILMWWKPCVNGKESVNWFSSNGYFLNVLYSVGCHFRTVCVQPYLQAPPFGRVSNSGFTCTLK